VTKGISAYVRIAKASIKKKKKRKGKSTFENEQGLQRKSSEKPRPKKHEDTTLTWETGHDPSMEEAAEIHGEHTAHTAGGKPQLNVAQAK
jgi:hypothetical protein